MSCAPDAPSWWSATSAGICADGPYAGRRAYDMLVQAEAGGIAVTGTAEQRGALPVRKLALKHADIDMGVVAHQHDAVERRQARAACE